MSTPEMGAKRGSNAAMAEVGWQFATRSRA